MDRELVFHRAVWDASQSEWLIRELNQVSFAIFALPLLEAKHKPDSDVRTYWGEHSRVQETDDDPKGHQALARAIVSGEPKEARRMMLRHILHEIEQPQIDMFSLERR
jgi:DNA-binding GntR family transcriptional regulator